MSMLTREFNYMRKSQRVDIPLMVQIGGQLYKTADWSMTGLGVIDFNDDIEPGVSVAAKLILPVVGASISVEVDLICRNVRQDKVGFEFVELSDRNKRVLRHYVELSIDGRLDNIEDLFADFSAPDIETPIKEALNMTEEEQVSLLRKFRSRAFLTMFAGFLLMGYIIFTLLYNVVFVYETIGVVSGNLIQITAGSSGILKKNYMKVGDDVHVNDILFDMDDARLIDELRKNKDQIERQTQFLDQANQGWKEADVSPLLALLKEEYEKKEREYKSASKLYADNVISIKDFQFVENSFSRARINYLRELEQRETSQQTSGEKKSLLQLNIDILKNGREQLLQRLEALRIKSPINGVVFTIDCFPGEYLSSNDVIVTLATRQNPFILFKMPSKQSGKAQLGMNVKIYSFETEQTYEGVISSIGYSSINPRATLLQEVSLEQTVIKVDLVGSNVDIPLNSRVDVWVKKKVPYLQKSIDFFRNMLGAADAETVR